MNGRKAKELRRYVEMLHEGMGLPDVRHKDLRVRTPLGYSSRRILDEDCLRAKHKIAKKGYKNERKQGKHWSFDYRKIA